MISNQVTARVLGWRGILTFPSKESTIGLVMVVFNKDESTDDFYARKERKSKWQAEAG